MDIENRDETLVNEILDVYEESLKHFNSQMSADSINEIKNNAETMIKNIENLIIVKDDEEKVIGFMGVEDRSVEMICLRPDYSKKGIGKQLMDVAINEHNVNKAHVKRINVNGIDFCKHMGFIPCEVINGEAYNDAIEMELKRN